MDGEDYFYYSGTNTYYFNTQSEFMIRDVMKLAKEQNLTVIRTWGFNSVYERPKGEEVYYQYFDETSQKPMINEKAFSQLDLVIHLAKQYGIKLIITFVNFWDAYGGVPMYLKYFNYDSSSYANFYQKEEVKSFYKEYVKYVISDHINSYTSQPYKEDDTILSWQLCNECRCPKEECGSSSEGFSVVTSWVEEMSEYVKSLDENHLVSFGGEGFFDTNPLSFDWCYNGAQGTNFPDVLNVKTIDYGTFHMYPEHWGKSLSSDWSIQWIKNHLQYQNRTKKPVVLEEFGITEKEKRVEIYTKWYNVLMEQDAAADHFWMLAGRMADRKTKYPDDGYTIYKEDTEILKVISQHSNQMQKKNKLLLSLGEKE